MVRDNSHLIFCRSITKFYGNHNRVEKRVFKELKFSRQISDIRSFSALYYAIWERGNYCAKSTSTALGLGSLLHDASMNCFCFYSQNANFFCHLSSKAVKYIDDDLSN